MPMIDANSETLHYITEGDGPAVLMIHSMGADVKMWRDQIAALSDRYTCIAFDCRGHGRSSYNSRFVVADVAADLKAGLDGLGVETCHVLGLALGGPIAISFAAQWPELVRSVIVADSFVDMRELGGARIPDWAKSIRSMPMAEFGKNYAKMRLLPCCSETARRELAEAIAKVPPEAYIDVMKAIFEIEFITELARVHAPALVIWGAEDDVTPLPHSRQIADGIPGARLETIAGAAHIANLDQPETFNALLAGFLDAQPR